MNSTTIFKRHKKLVVVLSLTLLLSYSPTLCLWAVQIHPKAGSTSATFLKIPAGSRATAMGSSFAGLADDVTAIYWNPAGLARLKNSELHLTHNELFENIKHDFAAYSFPKWGGVSAIGISGLYMPKDIERRAGLDEADPYEPLSPVEGYFTAYDMAIHFAYGRIYRKNTYVGAGIKIIRQTIDTESAYGAALDLGVLHEFPGLPLTAGLAVQHLGTPIKFISTPYDLPLNIKLGAAYRWSEKLVTTFDLNQPNDNYMFISAGMEYSLLKFMALRCGYRYRMYGLELGDLSGLSAGVGFAFPLNDSSLKFDYAFLPYGVLGNTHRVSIGIEFNALMGTPAPRKEQSKSEEKTGREPEVQPAPPPPVVESPPVLEEPEGYTVFPAKVDAKIRTASPRFTEFSLTAVSDAGDVKELNGLVRMRSSEGFVMNFAEKAGEAGSGIYKQYSFITNAPAPVRKAGITIALPKSFAAPEAKLKSGKTVQLEKISEDGNTVNYGMKLDELQDFNITSN